MFAIQAVPIVIKYSFGCFIECNIFFKILPSLTNSPVVVAYSESHKMSDIV